jgi:hypothetical protein
VRPYILQSWRQYDGAGAWVALLDIFCFSLSANKAVDDLVEAGFDCSAECVLESEREDSLSLPICT